MCIRLFYREYDGIQEVINKSTLCICGVRAKWMMEFITVHFKDGIQEGKGIVLEISEHGPVKLTDFARYGCVITEGEPKCLAISETVQRLEMRL